jgi:hypothetical protein
MSCNRYAIDDGADFSEAQSRIKALNGGGAGVSSVVSIKAAHSEPSAVAPKRKADGNDGRDKKKSKSHKHKSSKS